MINWTLRDLEVFLAVVETGSFRRAAVQVHLSQSAVSGVVLRLEKAVGARLLDRSTRHVALSEVGTAFHAQALRVLDQAVQAQGVVHDLQQVKRGRVRIATLPSLAATVLPQAMAAFRQAHPGVDLQLFDVLSGPAFDLVREGSADFAITAANPDYPDLAYRELVTDQLVLLLPPVHPLAQGRGPVRWLDALRYPHISMPLPTSVRQYANQACMQLGVVFEPRFELEHIATIHALVRAGLGVAALPQRAADLVSTKGLIKRALVDPVVNRPIGLVTPKGRSLTPACLAMVAELERALR
ncbi:MAG: hypothetical protein RJA09_785 [Pseudomonadota bacterium]|jgi:DNA-binding transcriptional LysR family regulator